MRIVPPPCRQKLDSAGRGLTLVECLIASVILAVAAAAITEAVTAGHMQTHDAQIRRRAIELAESLLEEILALPYCDPDDAICGDSGPGPEGNEGDRSEWDNADDCHGHAESAGSVVDAHGASYPAAYQVFQRSAAAAYGPITVSDFGGEIPGLTVTITVQDAAGRSWTLTRFKAAPPG